MREPAVRIGGRGAERGRACSVGVVSGLIERYLAAGESDRARPSPRPEIDATGVGVGLGVGVGVGTSGVGVGLDSRVPRNLRSIPQSPIAIATTKSGPAHKSATRKS